MSGVTYAFELRSSSCYTIEEIKGKADTDIRKVTGTLRSQERPKLKSSLLSLSIWKMAVADMDQSFVEVKLEQ